MASEI